MNKKQTFHQRCVCGAEITLTNYFELVAWTGPAKLYKKWQDEHADCLPLFHEIQRGKLKKLLGSQNVRTLRTVE